MTADFLDRTRFGGMDAVQRLVLERLAAQVARAEGGSRGGGAAATAADGEVASASAAAATPLADVEGLDRVVRWVEAASGIAGGGGDGSAGSSGPRQETSDALVPLVLGLRRIQQLPAALRSMQDVACAHLRDAIRCAGGRGREGGVSRLRFPCASGTGAHCCVLSCLVESCGVMSSGVVERHPCSRMVCLQRQQPVQRCITNTGFVDLPPYLPWLP